MNRIEIYETKIRSFNVKGKDGKPDRTLYRQEAYLHQGGRFPVLCELPLSNPAEVYQPGEYDIHPESFKVDQYKGVQLDMFNLRLIKMTGSDFGDMPGDKKPVSAVKSPLDKAA